MKRENVLLRPSADLDGRSLSALQSYLRCNFDTVGLVCNTSDDNWSDYTDDRVDGFSHIVFTLPDNGFKGDAEDLDEDVLEDIVYAYEEDIPVYLAYRGCTSGAWRIYNINESTFFNYIRGISGSTEHILNDLRKNRNLSRKQVKQKLEHKDPTVESYTYAGLKAKRKQVERDSQTWDMLVNEPLPEFDLKKAVVTSTSDRRLLLIV